MVCQFHPLPACHAIRVAKDGWLVEQDPKPGTKRGAEKGRIRFQVGLGPPYIGIMGKNMQTTMVGLYRA